MNFTAQETTLKLGNNKPTNFESDYRSNYLEHPIEMSDIKNNRLEELKAKLKQTNFELDQIGNTTPNPQSMYQENYNKKQMENPGMGPSQHDHLNLQKTNFMLGNLGERQQQELYQSETAKNYVKPVQDPAMIHQDLKNANLESESEGYL